MGFEHKPLWGTISFMYTFTKISERIHKFTRISERILCKVNWVFITFSIGFEHQEYHVHRCMGFLHSFMGIFTEIPKCILCKFKQFSWQLNLAILIAIEHQEYRSVYCANLNGFSWQF